METSTSIECFCLPLEISLFTTVILNKEIIENKFPNWNIETVQITLDGMSDEYQRRKKYVGNNENIFNIIIDNINCLAEHNINVSVRLNIDAENSEECLKVAEYLKKYSDNEFVQVYPSFLTGTKATINNDCDRISCSKKIYQLYNPENELLTTIPKINDCFYQQESSIVIDTDGSILCCDRDVGKRKTKFSNISDISNFDDLKKDKNLISKLRNQCKICVYYPKCGGGCMAVYNNSCKYDACFMEKYKTEFLLNKIIEF